MIRTLKALALVLALSPMAAFAGSKIDVKVTGMSCGACVKKVNDELAKLPDVEAGTIVVDLAGNNATLTLKKADKKSLKAVEDALKKVGYPASKIVVLAEAAPETKAN